MKLGDVAKVVRSKNAGPFILTFDILMPDETSFERLRSQGTVTRESVARAYGVSANEILEFDYYPFAKAIKFSLRRPVPSGAPHDTDVYGAQQHVPLLEMDID